MGMDSVNLLFAVEDAFDITISDEVAGTIITVGDFHAAILAELERKGKPRDSEAVFERLRMIIHEEQGIPLSRILPQARIVEDLRID